MKLPFPSTHKRQLNSLLLSLIIFILLCSCASHEKYPPEWHTLKTEHSSNCSKIIGKYENSGESTHPEYKPELSSLLFPDKKFAPQATHISFTFHEPDIVDIAVWENSTTIFHQRFAQQEGEVYCEDGLLKIDLNKNVNQGGALATEWSTLSLGKSQDSLIVKNENGAIGMMFLIPIAGTGTSWYKFRQSEQ